MMEITRKPRMTARTIEEFRKMAIEAINIINEGNDDQLIDLYFSEKEMTSQNIELISDSYSSPVGEPRGKGKSYDGIECEIVLVFSSPRNTGENRRRLENAVESIEGINLGSGSGSWDGKVYKRNMKVRLFLSDFPLIQKQVRVDRTMNNLNILDFTRES